MTPFGNINLDSLFGSINAANPLQPGDAFTGLEAGDSSIGADAFSIGDTTFDPITSGREPKASTLSPRPSVYRRCWTSAAAPDLAATYIPLATQDFNVYDGTGASATEVGSIVGNEDVTNLLGLTDTEFTVASVTAQR